MPTLASPSGNVERACKVVKACCWYANLLVLSVNRRLPILGNCYMLLYANLLVLSVTRESPTSTSCYTWH